MKHLIKGFTQFINENSMADMDREAVATAYSGNSNEEMLRLTFSNNPGKEILISLDSLANVLDPAVLDSNSDEDQDAINKALWTRAQEIAKRAGCSVLIDNESDEEIDLTGRAEQDELGSMGFATHGGDYSDLLRSIKKEIENYLPKWNTTLYMNQDGDETIRVENPADSTDYYTIMHGDWNMLAITKGDDGAEGNTPAKMVNEDPRAVARELAKMVSRSN